VEINCLNLIFPLTREESGKTETRVPALYDACPGRRYPPHPFGQRKSYPIENIDIYLVLQAADAPKNQRRSMGFCQKIKKRCSSLVIIHGI